MERGILNLRTSHRARLRRLSRHRNSTQNRRSNPSQPRNAGHHQRRPVNTLSALRKHPQQGNPKPCAHLRGQARSRTGNQALVPAGRIAHLQERPRLKRQAFILSQPGRPMHEHYFTEEPTSPLKIFTIKTRLRGQNLELSTATGTFSKKRIDKGTALLASKSIIKNDWNILDLGCGYGVVGIAIKLSNPTITLTLSDINKRALKLTRKNLEHNHLHADVLHSNGFEHLTGVFDTILLNPPQTAGKKICYRLIEDSIRHLKKNGLLQLVARHNKGGMDLSEKMLETYHNVKELCKKSGYRVYLSKKRL